jgi:hypothetical protein
MRRFLSALTVAAAAALATPALAAPYYSAAEENPNYATSYYVAPVAGVAVGTAVGVGLYNGWYGTSVAVTALPATAVGSAAVGGVAGVGTFALIDAAAEPCRGFHALLTMNRDQCSNGVYVGYAPHRPIRRMSMR